MPPDDPVRAAYTEKSCISTADEFNIWCALNDKPFNLVQHVWPDCMIEWDLEINPGTAASDIIYGTGQDDESTAVISAFAFIAGVEWAEEQRPLKDTPDTQDQDTITAV